MIYPLIPLTDIHWAPTKSPILPEPWGLGEKETAPAWMPGGRGVGSAGRGMNGCHSSDPSRNFSPSYLFRNDKMQIKQGFHKEGAWGVWGCTQGWCDEKVFALEGKAMALHQIHSRGTTHSLSEQSQLGSLRMPWLLRVSYISTNTLRKNLIPWYHRNKYRKA